MLQKISASAGSGKTYTLTKQFLARLAGATPALLVQGCALGRPHQIYGLEEILAATFTNKAAAEMRIRIITSLKTLALEQKTIIDQESPNDSKEKSITIDPERWVLAILQNYTALNIRTIDSLLHSLVRLSALSANLSPDFEPTFSSDDYFIPVYDGLMADLAKNDEMNDVPFDTTEKNVFYSAEKVTLQNALEKACLHHLLFSQSTGFTTRGSLHTPLLDIVERLCRNEPTPVMHIETLEAELVKQHSTLLAYNADLIQCIEAEFLEVHTNLKNKLQEIKNLTPYSPLKASAYLTKESFDECLNKKSKGTASRKAQAAFKHLCVAHQESMLTRPLLAKALSTAPLTLLAHEIYSRIQKNTQTTGLLPALSIPALAAQILQGDFGVSNALCRLGSRLLHILLDEFQDTSNEQWTALYPLVEEALAHGGSLTYVGDTKQAIYSWRGGDAQLFETVVNDPTLCAIAGTATCPNLQFNWRSRVAIVEHNNTFFAQLQNSTIATQALTAMLPNATPQNIINDAVAQAHAMFSSVQQKLPPNKECAGGKVHLYQIEGHNNGAVTLGVEKQIFSILENSIQNRKLSDFGILVHSSQQSNLIAGWLTKWGISVITQDSFALADQMLICRLVHFLTFLDYPLDDLAFWQFISGPECFGTVAQIQEEDLLTWLAQATFEKNHPPLYRSFKNTFPLQWKQWIDPFFHQAGFMTAYDTVFEIIKHYNLFEYQPQDIPFLQRFLELIHQAEEQGISALAEFLQFWETRAKDEKLPLPENMNAVRIMTVHKAKGLEFPVVILPFHHGGRAFESKLTQTTHKGLALLVRSGAETPEEYYPACVTEALEKLNLLYVGWTRPREELHAIITQPQTARSNAPLQRGLAVLLESYLTHAPKHLYSFEKLIVTPEDDPEGETESLLETTATLTHLLPLLNSENTTQPQTREHMQTTQKEQLLALQLDPTTPQWQPMGWLPNIKIHRSVLEEVTLTPTRRGTLTHLCLEYLSLEHVKTTEEKSFSLNDAVDTAITHALYASPLPLTLTDAENEELRTSLIWFAKLPEAEKWLQGDSEQSLLNATGQVFRIDLLVDQKELGLLALEFKTGNPHIDHQKQLQNYLYLLKQTTTRPVVGKLIYLDQQQLVEVLI